jgi:hypothetical protein
MLAMELLTHGILSESTNLNTSIPNINSEWLMACRVMVLTEGDILGSAAIDDMDAILASHVIEDVPFTDVGVITNAL